MYHQCIDSTMVLLVLFTSYDIDSIDINTPVLSISTRVAGKFKFARVVPGESEVISSAVIMDNRENQ